MTNWISATGASTSTSTTMAPDNIASKEVSREPAYVVGNGGIEVTGTGPVRHNAPASYTAGQEAPADNSIMATVKSGSGGMIINRSPNGNDIISIGGMTTTISAAVHAGLLVRNQDGSYADKVAPVAIKDPAAEAKTKAPAEVAKDAPSDAPEVTFGETAEAALTELMGTQMPGDLIKTMDSILQRGDVDQRTIEKMASFQGIEPGEMTDKVMTVWNGVYETASNILADAGVHNEDAFVAFLNDNPKHRSDLMEASRNLFMNSKSDGLPPIGEAYLEQADVYDTGHIKDLLTEAGWSFTEKAGGRGLFVKVNGADVPWNVAVRQKIITFSKR